MFVKMISCMKHTKDRMDNFMPVAEMNQLLDVLKSAGATNIEIATVIGHPNFLAYSKQWADAIHSKGMSVTWRCAHWNMEGLYNQSKFVGTARKPVQFWIDEAVKAAQLLVNNNLIKLDDEWAIYPERTEGIFQDATSWIDPNGLPGTYGQAFIDIHNACKAVLTMGVITGMSANNASELFSGWMPAALINYAGVAVVDHYVDGDPVKYEADIRLIKSKYGKAVYVQEGAPSRFTRPTRAQADAYYAVNKKLQSEGILADFGSWSGWAGNPESIVDKINNLYQLNDNGLSLQAWWGAVTPTPTPEPIPTPTPTPTPEPIPTPVPPEVEQFIAITGSATNPVGLTNKGNVWKFINSKWTKMLLPVF